MKRKGSTSIIKNIIFDLDGTLVDSADDIVECLQKAFSSLPQAPKRAISRTDIGPTLTEIIKIFYPGINDEQLNKAVIVFRGHYDSNAFLKTKMFDGVYETLRELIALGLGVFLVTNKPIIPTKRILKNLKIDFFRDIMTPDIISGEELDKIQMVSRLMNKWHLEKSETLMVGDSALDIIAAASHGLISVAVQTGYGSLEQIKDLKPDFTISGARDLYGLLTQKINAKCEL